MAYFGKFLIIENDGRTLDIIQRDKSLLDKHPSSFVRTVNEATNLLEKFGKEFRLIFLSEKISKIFDITSLRTSAESLGIQIHILTPPPASYMDLVKIVEKHLNQTHDWSKTKDDGNEKDKEIISQDDKFIEINMRDFVITPKSFFNFYLRLSAGKYIKVINAGDDLLTDEISRYRSKGIDEFFVPKEEHEKFLRLQGSLSAKVVLSDASQGFKIKTLMKLGANVTNNLLKCGITPDRMDNAHLFLDQTIHVLRAMKMKNDVITDYLKNIDQNEHSAAVAFIAGILANHLGFESSKSIKVVGAAALLHDIGLYALDPSFKEGDEMKDEKKKEIFNKHAAHGAEILRSTGAIEEVICHAIENHHHRRMGENSRRRSSSVNLVTEIVSVSDEFFNTVIHNGYSPEKFRIFMDNELKTYSPNVEKAFKLLTKSRKAA